LSLIVLHAFASGCGDTSDSSPPIAGDTTANDTTSLRDDVSDAVAKDTAHVDAVDSAPGDSIDIRACNAVQSGIVSELEATPTESTDRLPYIEELGEAYATTNNDIGIGGHTGFQVEEAGAYTVYLSHDVDFELKVDVRPNGGGAFKTPESTSSVDACSELSKKFVFSELEVGPTTLIIGPTDIDPIRVVIVNDSPM